MYPSSFDLTIARSVDEALTALHEGGEDARILAGGQSLIPMMKLRFAFPSLLVDINEISELSVLERSNGHLRIGATVRHAALAASDLPSGAVAAAAPWVADPLVRNRGTLCGSVAHCDPEGDWNSVLLATGAEVVARRASASGASGERIISIGDFVQGPFTNALDEGEMVTEVRVPIPSRASGGAYLKLERKVGDYATVAVAVHLELGDDGRIAEAGIAMTSVAPSNRKVPEAEDALRGELPSEALFAEAASLAAAASEPRSDVRGSAEWKRNVVSVYTKRGLEQALNQARSADA